MMMSVVIQSMMVINLHFLDPLRLFDSGPFLLDLLS